MTLEAIALIDCIDWGQKLYFTEYNKYAYTAKIVLLVLPSSFISFYSSISVSGMLAIYGVVGIERRNLIADCWTVTSKLLDSAEQS